MASHGLSQIRTLSHTAFHNLSCDQINQMCHKSLTSCYNLEKIRANSKSTTVLINEHGQTLTDLTEIMNEQFKFYQTLYRSDPDIKFILENHSNCKLSSSQVTDLAIPFIFKDYTEAAKLLAIGKSPGPDGLPVEVYQCFWSEIGDILYKVRGL